MAVRVTAVVPTLGASPLLRDCLRALRAQRADGERPEIVLLVQGAQSVQGAQGDADRPTGTGGGDGPGADGPAVGDDLADRVVRLPRNLGFAAATNRGIALADGPYVAAVNDDVVLEDGWLATLVDALEGSPGAASAQGVNLQGVPGRQEDGAHPETTPVDGWGLDWNRAYQAVQLGRGDPAPPRSDPPSPVFGVSATAALYRRAALLAVARPVPEDAADGAPEVFDTRLESYYEDVDLACRLRAAGHGALSVPAARAHHAGSLTGARLGAHRWRLLYGNRWAVAAGHLGPGICARAPRMALRDLADLARALVAGDGARARGIVGGWSRALRLMPGFLRGGRTR